MQRLMVALLVTSEVITF
ncbi:hypothetical protein NITLEN_110043 [Nitrospira lenta]|uniref:Uncharacterized protein n=1 Tax=Nitrospira lenta TaxID=1436998 RepID=A0A330L398_9BACT|nr:hypothetical protein NITLEN_110043 [Nitrospira lenta]